MINYYNPLLIIIQQPFNHHPTILQAPFFSTFQHWPSLTPSFNHPLTIHWSSIVYGWITGVKEAVSIKTAVCLRTARAANQSWLRQLQYFWWLLKGMITHKSGHTRVCVDAVQHLFWIASNIRNIDSTTVVLTFVLTFISRILLECEVGDVYSTYVCPTCLWANANQPKGDVHEGTHVGP